MPYPRLLKLTLSLITSLLLCAGCSRDTAPPTPLPAEQIPAALQQSFAKAKPEAQQIVAQINTALGAKDYPKAYYALQALYGLTGLTTDQQTTVSRALLTANNLLQEAQAKGDAEAGQTLKNYRVSK